MNCSCPFLSISQALISTELRRLQLLDLSKSVPRNGQRKSCEVLLEMQLRDIAIDTFQVKLERNFVGPIGEKPGTVCLRCLPSCSCKLLLHQTEAHMTGQGISRQVAAGATKFRLMSY